MTIKQPDDRSIDRERINGMLILLNKTAEDISIHGTTFMQYLNSINEIQGLNGKFKVEGEVVFEAGNL